MKKISSRPWILFNFEAKWVSEDELYYDEENFYAINRENQKAIFKLTDIIELKRTSNIIRNAKIWQLKIKDKDNKEITFNFTHNYRIWNNNFPLFYNKLKEINPNKVKSKWSLWSM